MYHACAVCGQKKTLSELESVSCTSFDLQLLRNDSILSELWPRSYSFHVYERAFLRSHRMSDTEVLADLSICTSCRSALKRDEQPVIPVSMAYTVPLQFAHGTATSAGKILIVSEGKTVSVKEEEKTNRNARGTGSQRNIDRLDRTAESTYTPLDCGLHSGWAERRLWLETATKHRSRDGVLSMG